MNKLTPSNSKCIVLPMQKLCSVRHEIEELDHASLQRSMNHECFMGAQPPFSVSKANKCVTDRTVAFRTQWFWKAVRVLHSQLRLSMGKG